MSGDVFNLTVDRCTFGTDGSDYAGIHLKSERGRGGSVHGVRLTNLVFHSETSTKQRSPLSASLYYSDNPPPTNASATPRFYDLVAENITVHVPASPTKPKQPLPPAFAWIGLDESKISNFRFVSALALTPLPHAASDIANQMSASLA
jgi:hypothetical protein